MTKLIKGVKLRLYPNKQQQAQLWQMFGNDRRVWNLMLDMAKQRYQNNPSSHFVNGRLQQLIEFFGQVTKEDLEWRFPSQTFPGTPI